MGYLRDLQSLGTVLDDVAERARLALADLQAIQGAADAVDARMQQVVRQQSEVQAVVSKTISSMSAAAGEVAGASDRMVTSSRRAAETSRQAADEVKAAADSIDKSYTATATRLDDLALTLKGSANLWDKAILDLIEGVKIGTTSVQELLTLYGDAKIGTETLREYLGRIDLTVYRDNIQGLVRDLHEGTASVDAAIKFLGASELAFAKQFSEVINLFRQGKVTLEKVKDMVGQIEKLFPDSDLADLAGAIEDALLKGDL